MVIFNFDNPAWKIKGILTAIVDYEALDKKPNCPFPMPKSFVAEIMGIIWVDENNIWNWKMRIKFPSGTKQVVSGNCGSNANETLCLQEMYKFPMKEKHWFKNPTEDVEGLIQIMQREGLIERMEIYNGTSN